MNQNTTQGIIKEKRGKNYVISDGLCDRPSCDRGFWRGLNASLLPSDYGPGPQNRKAGGLSRQTDLEP